MAQNSDIANGACITGAPVCSVTPAPLDASTKVSNTAYADAAVAAAKTIQSITAVITAAQFKAMDNTTGHAVTIIPAPGAGKVIVLDSISVNLQFVTPAYTTGTGNLELGYGSTGFPIANNVFTTTLLGQSSSHFATTPVPAVSTLGIGLSGVSNQAIIAFLSTATKYLAGNSTIAVTLTYHVINVS